MPESRYGSLPASARLPVQTAPQPLDPDLEVLAGVFKVEEEIELALDLRQVDGDVWILHALIILFTPDHGCPRAVYGFALVAYPLARKFTSRGPRARMGPVAYLFGSVLSA